MKTTESLKRAQAIINEADDVTADLIYEMWNELVRYEKREAAEKQRETSNIYEDEARQKRESAQARVVEYWKVRASAAEERIERAILASRLDMNLTAGEELLKRRILDALKSKINDYEVPTLSSLEMLLTAVTDKEFALPGKIRSLVDMITPDEFIGLLNTRGWILNPKLSQEHETITSVMVSPKGTRVAVPMDTNHPDYVTRMIDALDDYATDLPMR